jgi:hypothetical protein
VRFTHVSPLLYSDPADDVLGIVNTMRAVDPTPWPWLDEPGAERMTLRQLAARLATAGESTSVDRAAEAGVADRRIRWRSVIAAVLVAALGVGTAVAVYRTVEARNAAARALPVDWGRLDNASAK